MSNSINEAQHNYGKAVQIFCQNPNGGKFQLEVDAINSILNKIGNLPLVIYSVNGAKQTGKSFLLNFMMLYLAKFKNHFDEFSESDFLNNCTDIPSGFESRNDHDGVTVGMWLWSEPFIVKHQGREIAILLLDTQGHFDDRFERLKSSLIFALSTLLSDIFIYNAMLDISAERDLQFLQLFLDYSKKIGCNEQDKLKCALMLVRDFRPTLKYPYGYYDNTQKPSNKEPCSEEPCSKEPCNFAIDKLSPDSPLCLPEQLGFREEIHKCFDRVGCFLMPHPGLAIHSGSRNVLMEREFQDMLITFMKTIFSEPIFSIKTIAGQEITGRSLSQFVLQWNNEINTKEQPSILGFLEANEQVNNQMLIEKQLQIYQNEMNKFNIAMDETKLFNEHQKLASKCVSEYENALKLGSEEVHLRFKETFQTNIEVQWEGYRAKNSEKSLNKLNTEIRETLDDYNKKMANFCVKAISEECLVDEHKRLVELYMKRFDDDDEWKVGSAKDRNEFKVYFDRYIAKDMLNFWNENNCKSQESLSKLAETIIKLNETLMNIEKTFDLIPRDILNRKYDETKTRLLEIYDSLSKIGTNAMRAENKEHLVNEIQKTFEKICEEAQQKEIKNIDVMKQRIINICKTVIQRESCGFPPGEEALEEHKFTISQWINAKVDGIESVLDNESLSKLKTELNNEIDTIIGEQKERNKKKHEELLSASSEVAANFLPFVGPIYNFKEAYYALTKEKDKKKATTKAAVGVAGLVFDTFTCSFTLGLARLEIALGVFGAKTIMKATSSSTIRDSIKESWHKVIGQKPERQNNSDNQDKTSMPIDEIVSNEDEYFSIKSLANAQTVRLKFDNYETIDVLLGPEMFETIDDLVSHVECLRREDNLV